MPSAYAHNKFGKQVYAHLPKELKELVRKYPHHYRMGLHGPDPLFFYWPMKSNKITEYAKRLHKDDPLPFFQKAAAIVNENGIDSASHAYMLGYLCHYTLDKKCHPLVNSSINATGCFHVEIEGDLEQYLITLDGHTPESYPIHKLFPTKDGIAQTMSLFWPDATVEQIQTSINLMYLIKKMIVAPDSVRRTIVDTIAHISYEEMKGHMIMPEPNPKCRHISEELYAMFPEAVTIACSRVNEFENAIMYNTPLSDDFHGNFSNRY